MGVRDKPKVERSLELFSVKLGAPCSRHVNMCPSSTQEAAR